MRELTSPLPRALAGFMGRGGDGREGKGRDRNG